MRLTYREERTFEDTVENGVVLFSSEEPVAMPKPFELVDVDGPVVDTDEWGFVDSGRNDPGAGGTVDGFWMSVERELNKWASWVLHRRDGDDPEQREKALEHLLPIRDRVLNNAQIRQGETLLGGHRRRPHRVRSGGPSPAGRSRHRLGRVRRPRGQAERGSSV